MNKLLLGLAVLAPIVLGSATAASAATIVGLYNTGVDAAGVSYGANGFTELHYAVNGTPGVTYQHPAWVSATDAYWIAAQANGGYSINPGSYTLTFDLTGLDASTALISGAFAADDAGTVSLNGGAAIATTGGFSSLTSFSFASGFAAGVNTLTFTVVDSGGVPAGLLVSGLTGAADVTAVPEPAAWAMMLGGFGLVGGALRSRRRTMTVASA